MGLALPLETQRRLGLLTIVAVLATAWAVALGSGSGSPIDAASAAASPPRPAAARCPFPASLRPAFVAASRDASVPPALLYAVAKVESNMRQNVESDSGARGLLQVMPATAQALALNPDGAATNVLAGARYLRQLLDRFGGADLALAAYNAGPTAVAAAGGAPSAAVLTYVANVERIWHAHAGCS
jgi:soluble lytic murein transglycosylase-like protein